jgi:hypothetical protein
MRQYTKHSPKVQDYNPILHTSFYTPPTFYTYSPPLKYGPPFSNIINYSPEKNYEKLQVPRKNIFSQSGSFISRSASNQGIERDSPLFYKTKPRNKIIDPISGDVKVFDIARPKIESLDFGEKRDRLIKDSDFQSVSDFSVKKNLFKQLGTVSGSLKKEVPNVPYVNPFVLKTSFKSN